MIQMTWPGAPTIYYGDEAGLCGWTDPDNRRTYPWGKEDHELIRYHKELIQIHKEYQSLKTGSILFLNGEYQLVTYGRFDAESRIVVAINMSQETRHVEIPVWRLGVDKDSRMVCLMMTGADDFSNVTKVFTLNNGFLHLDCPMKSGMILKEINDQM